MRYYQVHTRRCRFGEFRRMCGPLGLPKATVAFVLLRLRLVKTPSTYIGRPDPEEDEPVPANELPPPIAEGLLRAAGEAMPFGFVEPEFEVARTYGAGAGVGGAVRARHEDGRSVFQATRVAIRDKAAGERFLLSFLADGSTIATADARQRMDRPPGAAATYHPGADLPTLVALHEAKLASRASDLVRLDDAEAVASRLHALAERNFEFNLARGVYEEVDVGVIRPPPLVPRRDECRSLAADGSGRM